jgi:hypothetical protein
VFLAQFELPELGHVGKLIKVFLLLFLQKKKTLKLFLFHLAYKPLHRVGWRTDTKPVHRIIKPMRRGARQPRRRAIR